MKKSFLFGNAFLFMMSTSLSAQPKEVPVIIADSLASGNYKDALTSFFQIAVDNLTGSNKEFRFTSNPFAIAVKSNPELLKDYNYQKWTAIRRLNFEIDTKIDSTSRFSGGSFGLKYAIIDRRDHTVSKQFTPLVKENFAADYKLNKAITAYRSTLTNTDLKTRLNEQQNKFFGDESFTINQLDTDIRDIIRHEAQKLEMTTLDSMLNANSNESYRKVLIKRYDNIKESLQNKPLLTATADFTSYDDKFQISNIDFKAQFLWGFMPSKKIYNLEMDIKAGTALQDDTSQAERDLMRNVLSIEPGINWVLKGWGKDESLIEFKLSGSYSYVISGNYDGEKRELNTVNGTLRIRLTENIWIPVEIKYDTDTGNLFGFLSVKSNFSWLKNELKQLQN